MKKIATLVTAVLASGILILSGCTPAPAPVPDRDVVDPLPDRDPAIQQEMMAIDPCALVDADAAAELGLTSKLPGRLFTCFMSDDPVEGLEAVTVNPWHALGQDDRFWMERIEIGGAVGYRTSPVVSNCSIYLPVSFTHAIRFFDAGLGDEERTCAAVETLATAAAELLLADPASALRPVETSDAFEACPIFEEAMGAVPDGFEVRAQGVTDASLATCGWWEIPSDDGFVAVEPTASLELTYHVPLAEVRQSDTWRDNEVRTVDGVDVLVDPSEHGCRLLWDIQPAGQYPGLVVQADFSMPDCTEASDRLPAVIAAARAATPAQSTGMPILYPWGEPDGPVTGPCEDVRDPVFRACAVARDTDVPEDAASLLAQGAVNPDVLCAAASDPVALVFARDFAAVTVDDDGQLACEFVTTDHDLVVTLLTSPVSVQEVSDDASAEVADFAGHPGIVLTDDQLFANENLRTVVVSPTSADAAPALAISVEVAPTRRDGQWDTSPIDTTPIDNIDEIADDLAGALFGAG